MAKIKIKKSWIIIAITLIIIAWYFIPQDFFKNPLSGYVVESAQRGDVLQEIFETGSIRATQDLSLGFKTIGKISKINVAVGDEVNKGDVLAQIDSTQILAQLDSAKSALGYTTNQYDSGVATAKDNLQSAYDSAQNILNDSYTKIYNAYNAVVDLSKTYFATADQEGIRVSGAKSDIQENMQDVKLYLNSIKTNSGIDSAVSETLINLDNIYNDLKTVREQCDSGIYYYNVSSTYKTSIDTQKTNINTALTNLTAAQSAISSYKIALQKAEDKAINPGSQTSSQIQQAQSNVDALQSQLNDSYLRSPIDGIITAVNTKKGEVVSPGEPVVNMLSIEPFQVKVDIYEQDIVNVKIGDMARIELVSFPKQAFAGKVISIDPDETIVDNVVYYKVTIDFPDQPDGVKSGMTADVTIQSNKKENVLRVPQNAIIQIDNTQSIQVVENNKIKNKTITTGLEGNDYYEITSGIKEGELIVVGKQ
jgi:multidrug efflux pump subunit AcrA (membrane-fusion protein)